MSRKKKGITKSCKQISKVQAHKERVREAAKKYRELRKATVKTKELGRDISTIVSLND